MKQTGAVMLDFEITGFKDVPVTIELCFNNGGVLTGTTQHSTTAHFLKERNAAYSYGGSTIEFGPGATTHKNIDGLEGERYSTHFGNLKTEGMYVYLTGNTPFRHTLKLT
ncbi:MAG: hypothetical protein HC867_10030 [Bacteroidia bacterium]|nr:hypothetical protein [Bacteroidia bacterium]